jgi:hypothetical protein
MDTIRARARSCTFVLPEPPDARPVDSELIRVTYSSASLVPRALNRASSNLCTDGQWYVWAIHLAGDPAAIALCPDACSAFVGDPDAAIEVTYTCHPIR